MQFCQLKREMRSTCLRPLGSMSSTFPLNFFARHLRSKKFEAFFGDWHLANGAQILQISPHKFCIMMLMELIGIFFTESLALGNFCLARKVPCSVTRPSEQKNAQSTLNIAQFGAHSCEKSKNLLIFGRFLR